MVIWSGIDLGGTTTTAITITTGTQAGLVAGFYAMGVELPVMGISVRQPRERQIAAVHALA